MGNSTAILLFSQSSSVDEGLRWAHSIGSKPFTAQRMIERAERLCKRSGLDYFRSDETTQVGESFGQKLTHAISEIFARGYQQLIVVGNDCPQLKVTDLRKCKRKLQQGQNIIGPDRRGGVYLLGLQASEFDAQAFQLLPWQQQNLHCELRALFTNAISLRSLSDLNSSSDFKAIAPWVCGERIWAVIKSILTELIKPIAGFKICTSAGRNITISRRGPPVLS
ncbi:MAG: DUF2064 domain-containing protein [Bacteroidota bacterium]